MVTTERRRSPRLEARFDTLVSSGEREGAGTLSDISWSGAHLDECSLLPQVGSFVRLYFYARSAPPVALEAVVSRHTDSGFAVVFEIVDAETRRVVDDLRERITRSRTDDGRVQSA